MKPCLRFSLAIITLVIFLFSAESIKGTTVISKDIPGWAIFSHSKPNQKSLECAGFSNQEWQVEWKEGNLQIHPRSRENLEQLLPFKITTHAKDPHVQVSSFLKTNKGWLVGFDGGEWGGELWWVDDKGNKEFLLDGNVVAITESAQGQLVFTGLAHDTTNYGKVYIVEEKNNAQKSVQLLSDLGASPRAIAQESKDSWYVLTYSKLLRLHSSGKIEDLMDLPLSYPNSMLRTPDGTIYIGSRLFVVRLTPKEKGFREEWLVPETCRSFKLKDYHCECVVLRKPPR